VPQCAQHVAGGNLEIAFLLVGFPFLGFGLFVLVSEVRTRYRAVEVAGEIVGFSARSSNSGGSSFRPVARFEAFDGAIRYVVGAVGSSSPLGSVGDRVTVLVDRADPAKAALKSRLSWVVGAVIALMGLASCLVFFAAFRISAFSLVGAAFVLGALAFKLYGARRKKPMSMQEWKDYKSRLLAPAVFTEETKSQIPWAEPARLQSAHHVQRKTSRIAAPVLLAAGIGLLALGIHLYQNATLFLATAQSARGVVVDLEPSRTSDDDTWVPIVEFEHEGRTYRFTDSVGSNPSSYRRGDRTRVLYDPSRPANARIDRGIWNRVIPLLIAGSGALLCVACLVVWQSAREDRGFKESARN